MPRFEINPLKKYTIPSNVSIIQHDEKYLVIAPNIACWIVLDSLKQVEIFQAFKEGQSIEEIMSNQQFDKQDIVVVVTQIEARHLYDKKVHSSTDDERSLHLYLTNKCNLSCPHCYMFSGKANENELTTEEIYKLLSDYRNIAKGSSVTLSGGEPTTRVDFNQIVKFASDLGLKVKILSNGVLLTRKRIIELANYVDSVQISIDGFSEESNSKVRGTGHFDLALSAVNSLLSMGVKTSVAITPPYEILRDHKEEYISFAINLLKDYQDKPLEVRFAGELLSGRLIEPSKIRKKEYLSLVESIQKEVYGPDYDVFMFVKQFAYDNIVDNCMYGVFSVASTGDVYFCARIGDLQPVSNIRTSSFEDIFMKSLKAEQATIVSKLKPCKDCELCYICGGGCRIDEFPDLTNRVSYEGFDYDSIPPRKCDDSIKNHFYDLMIRGNKYLYSSPENN